MPLAYGIGGLIKVPQGAVTSNGVPPASFKGDLGQQCFDISDPANPVEYVYDGIEWTTAGANPATTTTYGTVLLTDNSEPVATKAYADALVTAGAPVSTEVTAGIGQLATDAEAIAGTASTGLLALFVTPSNLAPVLAAGTMPGSFTGLTATGAVSFTGATGALTMTSATASSLGVTGAGIDLTLDSAAGQLILTGGEAAINAVRIQADDAAGGIDADAGTGGITIDTTGAISIDSQAASNFTVTGATFDLTLASVGGSVKINSDENAAGAIALTANGGVTETITITASQGTGAASIGLSSTAGGVTIAAGLASNDAVNINATAGGIDVDGAGQINIASSQAAADAILLDASNAAGGIEVQAGTGGIFVGNQVDCTTIDVGDIAPTASRTITVGGGTIVTAAVTDTIDIGPDGATTNADSIKTVNVNTGGVTTGQVLTNIATGAVTSGTHTTAIATGNRAAGTMAVNLLTGTGTKTLSIGNADGLTTSSILGPVNVNVNQNNNVAINTGTSTGTITIGNTSAGAVVLNSASTIAIGDASSGAITVDTAAGISLDAATASNFTVTGVGADLTLSSAGGSVKIDSTENAVGAIALTANGGIAETITITASQGTGAASIGLSSTAGGVTIAGGLGTADAVNITASTAGGGIDIDSSTGGFDVLTTGAISLDSALASNLTVTGAADLTVNSTAGALILTSGETNEDSLVITSAGGINMTATGAADKDIDVVCTNGSMNVTIGENISNALVINCSGAASGISIDCGTAGITFGTGICVSVTSVAAAATPYSVLGTDYFITTDTTGGVLSVVLPAAPATGRMVVVYDGVGQAAGNNVTIDGNGKNIAFAGASAGTKLLNTAYESATLVYNGTLWCARDVV